MATKKSKPVLRPGTLLLDEAEKLWEQEEQKLLQKMHAMLLCHQVPNAATVHALQNSLAVMFKTELGDRFTLFDDDEQKEIMERGYAQIAIDLLDHAVSEVNRMSANLREKYGDQPRMK